MIAGYLNFNVLMYPFMIASISTPPAASVSVHPWTGSLYELIMIDGLTIVTLKLPRFF